MTLSMLLLEQGELEESERLYRRVLEMVGSLDAGSLGRQQSIRGRTLLALGHVAEAEEPLRRALEQDPGDRSAKLALASCLVLLDSPEESAELSWEVLEKDPGSTEASRTLCTALAALGDDLTLEEELRRRTAVAPGDGVAWLNLAELLEEMDPRCSEAALLQAYRARASVEAEAPDRLEDLLSRARRAGLAGDPVPR
jgi:tetratricopeptide (TPR) repeat protein